VVADGFIGARAQINRRIYIRGSSEFCYGAMVYFVAKATTETLLDGRNSWTIRVGQAASSSATARPNTSSQRRSRLPVWVTPGRARSEHNESALPL